MIKTIEINDSILAAFKGMVGTDAHEFNAAMQGCIPDGVMFNHRAAQRWEIQHGEEVADVIKRDINYCEPDEPRDLDLMAYCMSEVANALQSVTGWVRVHLNTLQGPARGSSSGLYLFTCPWSNACTDVFACWADDEWEALEELGEWMAASAEDEEMTDAEYEAEREIWLSSPAYALIAA